MRDDTGNSARSCFARMAKVCILNWTPILIIFLGSEGQFEKSTMISRTFKNCRFTNSCWVIHGLLLIKLLNMGNGDHVKTSKIWFTLPGDWIQQLWPKRWVSAGSNQTWMKNRSKNSNFAANSNCQTSLRQGVQCLCVSICVVVEGASHCKYFLNQP